MNTYKKAYFDENWHEFSKKIKERDNNKCTKCKRTEGVVILQTHHKIYKPKLKPWEYPLSDCITLCKGCHSRKHGLIEPSKGWILTDIYDLGDLSGSCERKGCGTPIRYEHHSYHPEWGFKIIGSTCIEHLTKEDQGISNDVLNLFKKTSAFVNTSHWDKAKTKNKKEYLYTTHNHHQIRIYGKEKYYSFQIVIKEKGKKWFDFKNFIKADKTKNLEQVKELGYLVLKGLLAKTEEEKVIIRNVYSKTR